MTLAIDKLQALCFDSTIAITKHAMNRLVERGIMLDDIISGEPDLKTRRRHE